jgi:proprotein convertase subtilisin/kexin type 5
LNPDDHSCNPCSLQYYADTNGCSPCITDCSVCTGPTGCTTCTANHYLYSNTCVLTCPDGFTTSNNPNICYQCDSTCATCNGPSSSQCTTCSGLNYLTPSGTCSLTCPASFYGSNNLCTICPSGCVSCSSATSCQTSNCLAGSSYINGVCQACASGKGSAAGSVGPCTTTCNANCRNCDGSQTCLISTCLAGTYLNINNACVSCSGSTGSQDGAVGSCSIACGNADCAACSVSQTGSKTCIASNCVAGKYFDRNSASCLSCTGGTGSASNSMSCSVTCLDANCKTCNAANVCLSCKAGYISTGSSCTLCTGGKGSKAGDSTCTYSCASGCSACSVSNSGIQACLGSSCSAGSYFDINQNSCLQCSGGLGSQANTLNACTTPCYTGCSSCSIDNSGAITCLTSTCSIGTYASDTNSACTQCPSGQGSSASSLGLNSCFTCDASCSSCFQANSASSCIQCSTAGLVSQNGICQSGCSNGALKDTNLNICYTCNTNCLDCNHQATDQCISCRGNLYLNPSTKTCVTVNNCPHGYYPLNNICNQCPTGCSSCQYQVSTSSVVCINCASKYFPQGTTCVSCNPACTTC